MPLSISIYVLTLLVLGCYTFFSLRRDGWRKYVGPIGFSVVVGLSLLGFSQTVGGCIPEWMAFNTKMDVLAIAYDQPRAVYLWGVENGAPKCVALPWQEQQAIKVRGMQDQGGQLEYVHGSDTPNGMVHPKPQPPNPPKDGQ